METKILTPNKEEMLKQDFFYLVSNDLRVLEQKVNEFIKEGYSPVGSASNFLMEKPNQDRIQVANQNTLVLFFIQGMKKKDK